MGANKLDNYSTEDIRNAQLGRVIGAPARIVILRFIYENQNVTGPQLQKVLTLGKPTIQQHLEALVESGLICGNYENNQYCWKLNPETLLDFQNIKWTLGIHHS